MSESVSAHVGELAAVATACCWVGSAFSFEAAGRAVGSLAVNLIRLLIAVVFLALVAWVVRGQAWPTDASAHAWLWLSISGVIGFAFGDLCLFRAFVVLGARLSTLVMSLVPPITVVIGWALLGETLSGLQLGAVALTVAGVIVAVRERPARPHGPAAAAPVVTRLLDGDPRRLGRGLLLGLGGALGQAGGLVLSKYGMRDYSALAATQIRVFAGIAAFAVVFTAVGWWPRLWAARKSGRGLGLSALGALMGPVTGVTLSLYAVQHTETGVAASIMSITPILAIPVAVVIHGERVTARSLAGALAAVVGVVVLFL
ncbi:DMT family transporter [Haliangium sp.]|uniref:DMT family transporter n=1 Tax=Haliangium sp. TaxID=2663208 RepID=UPI003D0C37A6